MKSLFIAIKNHFCPAPETRIQQLSRELEENWKELQNAQKMAAKWNHSVNLYCEENDRIAAELNMELRKRGPVPAREGVDNPNSPNLPTINDEWENDI